ncbi:hypothetical protein D9M71_824890 [compost metagenome]
MPTCAVVRRITAAGFQHPSTDFVADHNRRDELATVHRPIHQRQRRHHRRQHYRAGMIATAGIVQLQRMGGDAVEQRSVSGADAQR